MLDSHRVSSQIAEWAELELAPWRGVDISRPELLHRQRTVCSASGAARIMSIRHGRVLIEPHVGGSGSEVDAIGEGRAELYRSTIERLVREHHLTGSCDMLLQLGDGSMDYRHVPSFAFQKLRGSSAILLPDVDLLSLDLAHSHVTDTTDFADKAAHAMFVGSTTGQQIDADVVLSGKHERLRAACTFRDVEAVTFELPNVVQCDSPETERLIAELGVTGRARSWQEQFASRYLISMDGNGATCSRMAIGLRSNCALVKYNSAHLLYYFHGLRPWVHYVPVRLDVDVLQLVESAAATAERDQRIALEGQRFAEQYLHREAVDAYFVLVLRTYMEAFGSA